MIKSELITLISSKQPHLQHKDVELAINNIIDVLIHSVAHGERIEIRGFGGFSMVLHKARISRNPKTGEAVSVPDRHVVHFKPGLDMRDRVNASRLNYPTIRDL
jgi:integration host factor subunit beta